MKLYRISIYQNAPDGGANWNSKTLNVAAMSASVAIRRAVAYARREWTSTDSRPVRVRSIEELPEIFLGRP